MEETSRQWENFIRQKLANRRILYLSLVSPQSTHVRKRANKHYCALLLLNTTKTELKKDQCLLLFGAISDIICPVGIW